MKSCLKCHNSHNKQGRFCSRTCANSRGPRTDAFKNKVRERLIGKSRPKDVIEKVLFTKQKQGQIRHYTQCIICQANTESRTRKTCSSNCFIIFQSQKALAQKTHGGGHKGTYRNFYCDSTWELAFLIWHIDKNIDISRCHEIRDYSYKGKISKYIPDFVVNQQIYEIKGFMSARSQAKLKCNPDIIVLTKKDIKKYIDYVKKTYDVTDLRDLYEKSTKMKHTCKSCHNAFYTYKETAIFCSRRCAGVFQSDSLHR